MTIRIDTQYNLDDCKTPEEYYEQMTQDVPGEWNADVWYWRHKRAPRRDEFAPLKYFVVGAAVAALVLLALAWYVAPDELSKLLWSLLWEFL